MKEIAGDGAVQKETCKICDFGRYPYSCTALGVNLWETNSLFCLAILLFGLCFGVLMLLFQAVLFLIPVQQMGLSVDLVVGGIGRFGKSGDFALDDGCIDKSCGFCNRGNNALFHRGNDSKNVSIPVALRIEKITGRISFTDRNLQKGDGVMILCSRCKKRRQWYLLPRSRGQSKEE